MPTTFRPYQPDQALLLPPDYEIGCREGHLAHHVSDLVDGLDLTAFYAPYEGDGRRKSPYEPVMMAKTLIYGYATGVFSSRGLARKLEEDVAFRVLAAGNYPSHRTICEFRRRHLSDFKALFVEVIRLARETGVANFGKLSIDGTKVRANASKRKAMSYGRMREEERRLAGEIEALLSRARETRRGRGCALWGGVSGRRVARGVAAPGGPAGGDPGGQGAFGGPATGGGRGAGTQARFEAQPEGRAALQAGIRGAGREGAGQLHGSGKPDHEDLDGGFQQCYNAQVAVEGENQLIVATEVSWNANDQGRMVPLVDEVEATHGERPETVLADAGYCNEDDLQALEARGVDGYVALGREGKHEIRVNAAKHPAKARMAEKLATEAGRAQYAQRKWLSEAPNGWIKEVLGFRRFSLRGLNKVRGEWDLVCLALNVKRMQGLQAA